MRKEGLQAVCGFPLPKPQTLNPKYAQKKGFRQYVGFRPLGFHESKQVLDLYEEEPQYQIANPQPQTMNRQWKCRGVASVRAEADRQPPFPTL